MESDHVPNCLVTFFLGVAFGLVFSVVTDDGYPESVRQKAFASHQTSTSYVIPTTPATGEWTGIRGPRLH